MENELLTKMWVINLVTGEPGVGLKKCDNYGKCL
jgi:hypothetical protein